MKYIVPLFHCSIYCEKWIVRYLCQVVDVRLLLMWNISLQEPDTSHSDWTTISLEELKCETTDVVCWTSFASN